jgi:hypothetical protein
VLTLTTKDEAGSPLSISRWKKANKSEEEKACALRQS